MWEKQKQKKKMKKLLHFKLIYTHTLIHTENIMRNQTF